MSYRVLRLNELIKRELSQIILDELGVLGNVLVTLTRVEIAPDLSIAKAYISAMPESEMEKIIKILKQNLRKFQREINKRLKMKIVPRIIFVEDEKTKEASRIEEILEKIKKEDKS